MSNRSAQAVTRRAGSSAPAGRGSGLFNTFRVFVTLQAVAILGQAIFAGILLEGDGRTLHAANSFSVHLFALLQVIFAILVWRPGRQTARYILPSVLLLLFGFLQSAMGGSHNRYIHIPLGALLLAGAVVLTVQVWSERRSSAKAKAEAASAAA
ncbi:hypothetical protein [Flindersiella endophytica]